jgi:dihydroorotate dehydrogenase
MYRHFIRLLQHIDQTLVYRFAYQWTRISGILHSLPFVKTAPPRKPVTLMGLEFPNPVGLAAGFDRDAGLLKWLAPAGFGFVEVGTVNFSREKEHSGDNDRIIANIERARKQNGHPLIGISIGSLNETPDARMLDDYREAMAMFWHHADYLVINLSRPGCLARSPDPANDALKQLLPSIRQYRDELAARHGTQVPVLIKLALDKPCNEPPLAIRLVKEAELDGVIVAFEHWRSREQVIRCIRTLDHWTGPLPLVVVGGVSTPEDAEDYFKAGAGLVQLFTALVEQGPFVAKKIVTSLLSHKHSYEL